MPEPTISDILGWGGGTFGAGADMGGMGLNDYLTNILSEAGEYSGVLDEGAFQTSSMFQPTTTWTPPSSGAGTNWNSWQDWYNPGGFFGGQNLQNLKKFQFSKKFLKISN